MAKVRATCVVPPALGRYEWPEWFEVLPGVGDRIEGSRSGDKKVVVVKSVIHKKRETMIQPPMSETFIELHCIEAKDLLLG